MVLETKSKGLKSWILVVVVCISIGTWSPNPVKAWVQPVMYRKDTVSRWRSSRCGLQDDDSAFDAVEDEMSWNQRRHFLSSMATTALACVVASASPSPAAAEDDDDSLRLTIRQELLSAIQSNLPEEQVIEIIKKLQPFDPSEGRVAEKFPERLDGVWELLWSAKADAFSPLLKLPPPFKPNSFQYLGQPAALEVGEGRLAQGLTGGALLGSNQLWLSSGYALPTDGRDPSVLEIQPPFRFQVGGRYGSNKSKWTVVEAGSDAEFRQLNARTVEAQQAGKNQYQQLYVESGENDALRISTVISGDPVIVGAIFVHRRVQSLKH